MLHVFHIVHTRIRARKLWSMSAEDRFECLLAGIRQASVAARIYQERHHICIVHALQVSHIERAEDRREIIAGIETRRVVRTANPLLPAFTDVCLGS
jgi:hypothetical protein